MLQIETPELCVIGAGAAGLSVAAGAAQLGVSTMLIEKNLMGGDCLNFGCVPSKSLIASARLNYEARRWSLLGIVGEHPSSSQPLIRDHIKRVIATIAPHDSQARFEGLGAEVVRGTARFLDERSLEVSGRIVRARRFVIASGSRPSIPKISGLADIKYLTNETVFDLESTPDRLLVIGGGPIGCELGQAFRRLGSLVTLVDVDRILAKEDPSLANIVANRLISEGIELHQGALVRQAWPDKSIEVDHDGTTLKISPTHILVATGRTPTIECLGLDEAGVTYSTKGIRVDRRLRTTNRAIFALGDAIEGPQLTHAGSYQAGIVIRNAIFRFPAKTSYSALPRVTYTDPEIAQVGLTEEEARQEGNFVEAIETKFETIDRAIIEHRPEGLIKIVLGRRGRVIGAGIVGHGAGELITPWVLAIQQHLKIRAMADLIVPYPTFSEISKRSASGYFASKLFSDRTRKLVRLLAKLP